MAEKLLKYMMMLAMVLLIAACDDEETYRDTEPPVPPENVQTFNRDGSVEIIWDASTSRDVAGYNVYYALDYYGKYTMIGSSSNNVYIDNGAENGEIYYYGITAYDFDGNESELSYDEVYGVARPEGYNNIVFDYIQFPDNAGFSFAENLVYPYNDYATDFFFERYNDTYYVNVWADADIQDMGPTDDILDITYAPESGWIQLVEGENVKYTEARRGHTYVVWTLDNHFAKFRISSMTPERMVFDWAYQLVEGERMLKRSPVQVDRSKVVKLTQSDN